MTHIVLIAGLALSLLGGDGEKPAPAERAASVSREQALQSYERFKKMSGKWHSKSTKGWEEVCTIKVIAAGSCVVSESFGAHPNETMLTMYHMDNDRLLLTHYCVAKNQPRLQLTGVTNDGRKLHFTFLDATNIPSRDSGHMDEVVYEFADDDHVTEHWSWYEKGKSRLMERIDMVRVKRDSAGK